MPPRISLALVFHNHQPVGNFGWVLEEYVEQLYLPAAGVPVQRTADAPASAGEARVEEPVQPAAV